MELSAAKKQQIIDLLKGADGEDVHEILKQTGNTSQMLFQLVMTEPIGEVEACIEERKTFEKYDANKK